MKVNKISVAAALQGGIYIAVTIILLSLSFLAEDVLFSNLFVSLSVISGLIASRNLSNQLYANNE